MAVARAVLGIAFFCAVAWGLSSRRDRFPWRVVFFGVGLQVALAALILGTAGGRGFFEAIAGFVTGLIESGVDFVAADMPHATKVMIQIHAVMAEHERDQISARTKAALAAAKARGVRLGVTGPANLRPNLEARRQAAAAFAGKLRPLFEGFELRGLSQRQIVAELNGLGIMAPFMTLLVVALVYEWKKGALEWDR